MRLAVETGEAEGTVGGASEKETASLATRLSQIAGSMLSTPSAGAPVAATGNVGSIQAVPGGSGGVL